MAGYQELIKDFEKIRRYMVDFYIYGFYNRKEFDYKSARTYDNERRRIESYLGEYVNEHTSSEGKQVYVTVDCATLKENPMYAAWKSKSFTNNDIILHFYILYILGQNRTLSTKELTDRLSTEFGIVFDIQAVRAKCREYEEIGLLESHKEKNTLYYQETHSFEISGNLLDAISYYQGCTPFGVVGSFLLNREKKENLFFYFKNQFIVHTLEDDILLKICQAIEEKRVISFKNIKDHGNKVERFRGIPLYISVSTQTGRRYVCLFNQWRKRFSSYRLDNITDVSLEEEAEEQSYYAERVLEQRKKSWGVSFGQRKQRAGEICMKLQIDEVREDYVLQRLIREGREGEITKVAPNIFSYSVVLHDPGEIMPWVKTFIGRILDFQCTERQIEDRFYSDMKDLYALYGGEE